MVAFFGFAALAIDLGQAYSQRRLAQNAADAAAMAGMRMVRTRSQATMPVDIHNEIARVAALNGAAQLATDEFLDVNRNSLGPVVGYSGSLSDVAGVRVTTRLQLDTSFARVLGVDSLTAGGKATAMSLAISGITGTSLLPIAVPSHPGGDASQSYDPDATTPYTIWSSDNHYAPGNVGWLDFDGGDSAAGQLADWLDNGFESSADNPFTYFEDGSSPGAERQSATLPVPSWLQGNTGLSNSQNVRSAVHRLDDGVGQSITVLLFDRTEGTGSGARYRIVGLAQFRIVSVDLHGNPETIAARFERMVYPGEPSATPTTSDSSTIRLTD